MAESLGASFASSLPAFRPSVCALVLRATFGGLQTEPTLNFDVVFAAAASAAAAAVYIVSKAKCHYSQNPCPRPQDSATPPPPLMQNEPLFAFVHVRV